MKKALAICLVAALLAAPVAAPAEDSFARHKAAILQEKETSLRDDIVAMRKEMERLSEDAGGLAAKLGGTPQADEALKLQGQVNSLIQRTHAIEQKMSAESSGVMASFREGDSKDENKKAK
jgi:hypothetical protein